MNYCILIESASGPFSPVSFTEDVYRLGRDRKCEIQVPTKAAHALTIFRRAASVFVLNRTKLPVQLGKVALASGSTAAWRPNTSIVIDGIRLKLQSAAGHLSDSNAGPAARMVTSGSLSKTPQGAPSGVSSSSAGQTKSERSQILVIAACMAMIGAMLYFGSGIESSNDKHYEQLAKLAEALTEIATQENPDGVTYVRVERLLYMLAQYRVSAVVEEKTYANVAKSEARNLCQSITNASELPERERKIVQQISVVLGQIR